MNISLTILLGLIMVFMTTLDYFATRELLRRGGKELNPILQNKYMPYIKGMIAAALLAVSFITAWYILVPPILLFMFACTWNYFQLNKTVPK